MTLSISPSVTRISSTVKTALATTSGLRCSSPLISCSIRAKELLSMAHSQGIAGGIPAFVVEAADQHRQLRSEVRHVLHRESRACRPALKARYALCLSCQPNTSISSLIRQSPNCGRFDRRSRTSCCRSARFSSARSVRVLSDARSAPNRGITRDIASLARTPLGHRPGFWQRTVSGRTRIKSTDMKSRIALCGNWSLWFNSIFISCFHHHLVKRQYYSASTTGMSADFTTAFGTVLMAPGNSSA